MRVSAEPNEWRVRVSMENDAEEALLVYELMQCGRLLIAGDQVPLPFRGSFLFKVPERPRPLPIQVGRFEPSGAELLAGGLALTLLISCPHGDPKLLGEVEAAVRARPPASDEEFSDDGLGALDEYTRIRKMTFAQRIIYATRAGQTGRAVMIQQPSPLLLLYLCKNPLITLPEIIQIAKLPCIDALVAEYLVRVLRGNPQWAMSEELKLALATNVKTPGGTALSLLAHLNAKSLRRICKQGEVRGAIKNAALRILTDRRE